MRSCCRRVPLNVNQFLHLVAREPDRPAVLAMMGRQLKPQTPGVRRRHLAIDPDLETAEQVCSACWSSALHLHRAARHHRRLRVRAVLRRYSTTRELAFDKIRARIASRDGEKRLGSKR